MPTAGDDNIEVLEIGSVSFAWDKGTLGKTPRVVKYTFDTNQTTLRGESIFGLEHMGFDAESIIVVNDIPLTTCSAYYKPISHKRLTDMFLRHLKQKYSTDDEPSLEFIKQQWYRMVKIWLVDKFDGPDGALDFGFGLTNSYDLSLGIHVDGFLEEKATQTRVFLGLAGSWKTTFKHYHKSDDLEKKLGRSILHVVENAAEQVKRIKEYGRIPVTPEIVQEIGRALWIQKKEQDTWESLFPSFAGTWNTAWVKNAGFTVQNIPQNMTAWDAVKAFTKFGRKMGDWRELDISQRIFELTEFVLKKHKTP